MSDDQNHELHWHDGVPVSTRFEDPFYSLQDGWAETQHVFLDGNGLPERFCDGFRIAELGFGTGLNFAVALSAWLDSGAPGHLNFTSFEAYPVSRSDAAAARAPFPDAAAAAPLIDLILDGATSAEGASVTLTLIRGDARETVRAWQGRADAWFLDGFAPARNPELWEPHLLRAVAKHTAPGGTFATYTAAGAVRRALATAGFDVERRAGYGRKRHMSVGRLP